MYTKLYARITESSLMEEEISVRYVFVLMLAICNQDGDVVGTDVALARRLNMPLDDFQRCVYILMKPDANSNSQECAGRRVIRSDSERGYTVVSYKKYRGLRDESHRRDYMREYQRKRRAKLSETEPVNKSVNNVKSVSHSEAEAEGEGDTNPPTPQSGDSVPEKRKPKTPFDPLSALSGIQGSPLDSPAFRAAWAEWATHRREVHKPLTPTAVKRQLADLTAWGHDAAVASIQTSIAAGWQGLFPPKPSKQSEGDAAFDKAWRDAV